MAIRERLRELAMDRRRFGYRRLGWMLAREGHTLNHKKLYRIYREERLMVRRPSDGTVRPTGRVADVMLFLASDQSRYCTGGVYMVDGGVSAT